MTNPAAVEQEANLRIARRAQVFNLFYDKIDTTVPFKETWNNGTGYYNGACHDQELAAFLKPGEVAKCISPMPNNRKIVLIGTRFGAVAIFERYTGGDGAVYVMNIPNQLRPMLNIRGSLSIDDLEIILGSILEIDGEKRYRYNVGHSVEEIAAVFMS